MVFGVYVIVEVVIGFVVFVVYNDGSKIFRGWGRGVLVWIGGLDITDLTPRIYNSSGGWYRPSYLRWTNRMCHRRLCRCDSICAEQDSNSAGGI